MNKNEKKQLRGKQNCKRSNEWFFFFCLPNI